MPYSALFLGIAGLIPFIAMPLAYQLNLFSITQSTAYFVQYSAVLLSFFGGIHWWDSVSNQRYGKQMYIAMLPTIVGWLCLVFANDVKVLGVLSLSYVALLVYDKFTLSMPKDQVVSYISMRMGLTTVVVLCHAWMIYLLAQRVSVLVTLHRKVTRNIIDKLSNHP